jgi:hypothetical protein
MRLRPCPAPDRQAKTPPIGVKRCAGAQNPSLFHFYRQGSRRTLRNQRFQFVLFSSPRRLQTVSDSRFPVFPRCRGGGFFDKILNKQIIYLDRFSDKRIVPEYTKQDFSVVAARSRSW